MDDYVRFFSNSGDFLDAVSSMLERSASPEILISGIWDGITYRKIVEQVINNNHTSKMKIIIPNVFGNGTLPRMLINKIIRLGGKVGTNNAFSNNLIVIDDSIFIATYGSKYSSESGLKNNFECCILTNCADAVNEIKRLYVKKWDKSFPLVLEDIQGDIV